jgi:curved DNA-binding protein CbpA
VDNALPDHYGALNVPRTASPRDILSAYRRLMRIHHPDVGSGVGDATQLARIMEAFAVLRNPMTREAYDLALRRQRTARPGTESAGTGPGAPQEVPVRVVRRSQTPPFRASPVRWESGPWAGKLHPTKEGDIRNE